MEADRIASLLMLALLAYVASVWARQRDELEQRRQDGDGPASGRRSTVELPADCGRNSFVWRPTGRLGGGRRNHRISAGFNARPGDFPSFVALRVGLFYCGGTLITNQHVLTAAHCAEISPDIIASVSIYHWENGASMNSTKLEQEKVCIAPNYNFERLHSDIAVIKLQRPVQFSHLVQPACLPDRPLTAKEQAYTIGLGYTSQNPPVFAKRLQILPVRRANCSRLKSLEPFYDGHESTLCFRSNRRNFLGSACSGKWRSSVC